MKLKNIFLMISIFFVGFAYSNKPNFYEKRLHFYEKEFRGSSLVSSVFSLNIGHGAEGASKGTVFYIGDNRFVTQCPCDS